MGDRISLINFINVLRGRLEHGIMLIFVTLYLATGLAAYNIGPIPIQWLARSGFIILATALIFALKRIRVVPGGLVFVMFIGWGLVVNALNVGRFGTVMPDLATLPYELYIIVRYVNLLVFAAVLYLTFWLLTQGYAKSLTNWIVLTGALVSLAALYIYIANIYGLPQPPRSRLGTSGSEQATTFSYGYFFYNRALGTFREPSHLAEWLLLPLFFSLTRFNKAARVNTLLIGSILLLTVSLGGILSSVIGIIAAILIINPLRMVNLKRLIGFTVLLSILAVCLQLVPVGIDDEALNIYSIIRFRILELIEGGVEVANLGYLYEFFANTPSPFLGYGHGNANIFLSSVTGNEAVVSYLSLYINVLYSTGVVGFGLLLFFLLRPIIWVVSKKKRGEFGWSPVFLMTYLAYLVFFGIRVEELSVPFAVSAAYLTYQGAPGLKVQGQRHAIRGCRE